MSISHRPAESVDNRLLAALPAEDYERLLPCLEPVSLSLGDVVYEPGGRMEHVYFPVNSIVSLLYTMVDGATGEVGLVGDEGMVGIALFMGGETTPNQAMVQGAGDAFRMSAQAMQDQFKQGGAFQLLLLRYTQTLITQISQTAVCNRLHSVEQRLCRWLLMTRDRAHTDELQMTHEFISNMLGIRREGVSVAAGNLQKMGAIKYARGHVRILDRQKLEDFACECYRVVKDEHERLLA